jgi:hypothetical protein
MQAAGCFVNFWRPTIAGSGTDSISRACHWLLFQCLDYRLLNASDIWNWLIVFTTDMSRDIQRAGFTCQNVLSLSSRALLNSPLISLDWESPNVWVLSNPSSLHFVYAVHTWNMNNCRTFAISCLQKCTKSNHLPGKVVADNSAYVHHPVLIQNALTVVLVVACSYARNGHKTWSTCAARAGFQYEEGADTRYLAANEAAIRSSPGFREI